MIQVDGTRFGWETNRDRTYPEDPEHCAIFADQPTVEVRGDLPVLLILLDVRGALVIVDVSSGGHDASSMQIARSRGYGAGAFPGATISLTLLKAIHDITFGLGGIQ